MTRRVPEGLIISCQPVVGGPQDSVAFVVGYALAARDGGAAGLRIEGFDRVEAVSRACDLPVIGIVKREIPDSPIYITPTPGDIEELARRGADIVAFDATRRPRPASVREMVETARRHGVLSMADCSDIDDARAAVEAGVDIVGTTLAGYTGGPATELPDLEFLRAAVALGRPVVAEGRYRTWEQAAQAASLGATAVVIGSAVTRTEHATGWFRDAIAEARRCRTGDPVLAIDLGGTKTALALVVGDKLIEEALVPTDAAAGPEGWVAAIAAAAQPWHGRFARAAVAATGLIADGRWTAINRDVLPIPDAWPLVDTLQAKLGVPATALNDAQAAAWGEYRHGAGRGADDIVFLTVSTGVGGGVVTNGRLWRGSRGLAGHIGRILIEDRDDAARPEDTASGTAIAKFAAAAGHPVDAVGVFAAARAGEAWAEAIIDRSAASLARVLLSTQMVLDPARIVIGGGVGLADGYLDRVRAKLDRVPRLTRPVVVAAELGARAGLVGAADFARSNPGS